MIFILSIVISITLVVSWVCSMLEGFILSITTAEIEAVKVRHPKVGASLERQKNNIERATAAILTLNTLANICGSAIGGYMAGERWGSTGVAILTTTLTFVVLFFCEILPKSIGVRKRKKLAVVLTPILDVIMLILRPVTFLSKSLLHLFLPVRKKLTPDDPDEEIILLVNKAHKDGIFSLTERELVSNILRLDDLPAASIMTPLAKVVALPAGEHIGSVLRHIGKTAFSRLPVYENAQIVGVVSRDDLLHAGALDKDDTCVSALMKPILKISDRTTVMELFQTLIKNHQELCLIEGAEGQTLGIATMEDVVKHLLGHKRG